MNNLDNINLNKLMLLYVEDEEVIRKTTFNIFRKFFKEVVVCENGQEGIDTFKKFAHKIDLILTDINMPYLNGIEMSKQIRQINPSIPIIVTTAYSDKNFLLDAISLGINEYGIKPISVQELIIKIKKAYFPTYQANELKSQEALLAEQSRNAEIGKVMLNVAHQWRQPLNELALLIQSYSTAMRKGVLEENIDEYTKKGLNTVKKLSSTIDDFMNFFNPTKQKEYFNINECINESLYYTGSVFSMSKIKVLNMVESNFELFGYKREFEEVIINILTNAKDAIEINKIQNGYIKIYTLSDEEFNYLIIFNSGTHIDEANMGQLFKPFFTTKQNYKGTGLGLFIAYDIIKNHLDGEITAKNAENGVEFILKFNKLRRAN